MKTLNHINIYNLVFSSVRNYCISSLCCMTSNVENGDVASQLELHLLQTLPLLSFQPYKHSKTTKLNPNTLWMKQNYIYIYIYIYITLNIIVSYLPWIILDSWKSNTLVNCFIRLVLLNFQSQFLTSHAIFNAYTQWVHWIISYKVSSFSIHDVVFRSTFPTP
jgi:hypothetical protein